MIDKKTPFTEAEISALFREREIDEKYFKRFYDYYIECFKEIYEDESKNCNEEDLEEIGDYAHTSALSVTDMYIDIFLKEKALNHGDEWAHAVAHSEEENENAYGCAYDDLNKSNPDLAKKELLILCKSHGGDEYFEKKFIHQFEEGHGYTGCTERATNYSESYKKKLAEGKSKVYAQEYAELMASGEYHPIYCEEFAYAYDKAISNGKNEEYAYIYADMYGEVLVDIKRRAGIEDDEHLIDFNIEKVNAYMNAWEYHQENKLKDFDRFVSIYENIYLNTYFADDGWPAGSKEYIDKGILEKALKTFN